MYRFIESIRIENGRAPLLEVHQQRVNITLQRFLPDHFLDLYELLKSHPPPSSTGVFKWRIVYGDQLDSVKYEEYTPRVPEEIILWEIKDLDYPFKFEDRTWIEQITEKVGPQNDVLFVKEGLLTDSSYANVVFQKDGAGWVTPESCLLPGVRRESLLRSGKIEARPMKPSDISKYDTICLINAMLDLGDMVLPTTQVRDWESYRSSSSL